MPVSRRPFLAGFALAAGSACVPRIAAASAGIVRSILDLLPSTEWEAISAGTSDFDCGPVIAAGLAGGGTIFFPAGRYVVATPIAFRPRIAGRFAPGVTLVGAGIGQTVFHDRTRARALLDFDSGTNAETGFRAINGIHLEGFTIEGGRAGATTAAIRFRGCYQSSIRQVYIVDRRGDGISIPCLLGDIDGSNMVTIEDVRIENCAGWGIAAAAAPGRNEISFLGLRRVMVQNCGIGAASGATPGSGGMQYKGQMLTMDQCAFTENRNVGLFIPGEAGLAVNIQVTSTAFENNVGRHLLCTGVSVFRGTNLQLFSNDQRRATTGCEFSARTDTVRGVAIDGVLVRATAGNAPYTAFRFEGPHLIPGSYDVRGVVWDDFGHPGQIKAVGVAL